MRRFTNAFFTVVSLFKYKSILRSLKSSNSKIVFFFPFYHTGGAEQVHVDILGTVADQSPLCIITAMSDNADMKESFQANAKIVNLFRWGSKRGFRSHMARKVAEIINSRQVHTVFSSNSVFFDEVIQFLDADIRKIDLIHTYLGDRKSGSEYRTLAHTHLLDYRIVLGERQKELTNGFYNKHHLDAKLAERITVIPNKVRLSNEGKKKSKPSVQFNVIFVSRNDKEKRPEMFVNIAKEAFRLNYPWHFTMVGDFQKFQQDLPPNIELAGRITDKAKLDKLYIRSHVILITSVYEGFPMVILEGMAHGVVPISTKVGEVPCYIGKHLRTGIIVEENPQEGKMVGAFIGCLERLSGDENMFNLFSDNVRTLVRNKFSEDQFNRKYRTLLLEAGLNPLN